MCDMGHTCAVFMMSIFAVGTFTPQIGYSVLYKISNIGFDINSVSLFACKKTAETAEKT